MVQPKGRFGSKFIKTSLAGLLHGSTERPLPYLGQGTEDHTRLSALQLAKALVPAAHRQAVRLAQRRTANNAYRPSLSGHQPLDHGKLLAVLLSEEGRIGPDEIEEPLDHIGHPLEVAGAGCPLKLGVKSTKVEMTWRMARVELFGDRNEHGITTSLFKQGHVAVHLPGVLGQVLRAVELERVDENAAENCPPILFCPGYQGYMTSMKGPHGRHEPDRPAVVALHGAPIAGLGRNRDELQCQRGFEPC